MLRGLVIAKMGRNGDEDIVAEARKKFSSHSTGSSLLPADLRTPVYATVLTHGDEKNFEEMLKLFRAADLHEEKMRLMRSLGAVKDKVLIQRVLDFSLSEEVRSQDKVFVISGVTGSVLGRDLAWTFLQKNWKELHAKYEGGFLLARLVKSCTENFVTEEKAKEVDEFFAKNPAPAAERTIQQSLENIRLNAKQLSRDSVHMKQYLESQAKL